MKISGLQKMTLLDFPGKVACTVFLQGCNFRCPFCHNSDLLGAEGPEGISEEELLAFLKKRVNLLDGVCITGGEPTLYKDLPQLLQKIKDLGYLIKLDTNGTNPALLKELAEKGLIDHVAMDIKNGPGMYGVTVGVPNLHLDKLEESIRLLTAGLVDYEFRTTVVAQLHTVESMQEMGRWLQSLSPDGTVKRLYLQGFMDRDTVLQAGLSAHDKAKMQEFKDLLAPCSQVVEIRGVD